MNMYVDRHLKPPRQSCCGFYFGKYSKGASHCLCHPLAPNFSKYGLAFMVGLGHSCLRCPSEIPVEISRIFEAHSIPKSSINRYPLLSTPFKKYFYRYHWYISLNIYIYIRYIYIYTIILYIYTNITTIFSSGILWTQNINGAVSKVPKAEATKVPNVRQLSTCAKPRWRLMGKVESWEVETCCWILLCMYIIISYMDISENRGTPKSSILIGFSIINHPFWGIPLFGNTHIHTLTCMSLLLLGYIRWLYGYN